MPNTPLITTQVTITSKSINNDSVASIFPNVTNINLDYYKGIVTIADANLGTYPFGLALVTAMTITVAGSNTVVTIV